MITAILICAALILGANLVSPYWWWVMLIPGLFGLVIGPRIGKGFVVGAIAGGGVWLLASLYFWQFGGQIIAMRVAALFQVGSPWILVLGSGLIGFVGGGAAAASGAAIRAVFAGRKPAQKSLPS